MVNFMLYGQKMKKSKNGLFLPTWKLFNFSGFQVHVHGKLQKNPRQIQQLYKEKVCMCVLVKKSGHNLVCVALPPLHLILGSN